MRSTRKQWEDFQETSLWHDMQETLEDWVDGIKTEVFAADSMDEVRKYQGRVEALQYFLILPQTIIESFEHEEGIKDGTGHDQTSG